MVLKMVNFGYLIRCFVDVVQDVVIVEFDCGMLDGVVMCKLEEGGKVIEGLDECILGCVVLDDIYDFFNVDEFLVDVYLEINEECVEIIENVGIEEIMVCLLLIC